MSGQSSNIVRDAATNAAPQFYDPNVDAYSYLHGDSTASLGEAFFRQASIVPFKFGNYTSAAVVKASAGTFFGAYGCYKGTVAVWIMVFDAASAPAANAVPLAMTSLPPGNGVAGPDVNWSISPGKPYTCSTGIYVALSSTGGVFTSLGNTDMTGTVEFI